MSNSSTTRSQKSPLRQVIFNIRQEMRFGGLHIAAIIRYFGLSKLTPEDFLKARRILIIRLDGIGDAVMTLPAIKLLRKMMPNAVVDGVFRPATMRFLRELNIFDNLYDYEHRSASPATKEQPSIPYYALLKILHKNRYDFVIDFAGRPLSRRIGFSFGAKRMVTPSWSYYERDLNIDTHFFASDIIDMPSDLSHPTARTEHIVRSLTGSQIPCDYELQIPDLAKETATRKVMDFIGKKQFALVHPVSSDRHRNWPIERFVTVTDHLVSKFDLNILVTGSARDEEQLSDFRAKSRYSDRILVAPSLFSLTELMEVCRLARIVISVDTSIVHLADGVGANLLALYTPYYLCNHPFRNPSSALSPTCPGERFTPHVRPEDEEVNDRIKLLQLDDVLNKVDSLLYN